MTAVKTVDREIQTSGSCTNSPRLSRFSRLVESPPHSAEQQSTPQKPDPQTTRNRQPVVVSFCVQMT